MALQKRKLRQVPLHCRLPVNIPDDGSPYGSTFDQTAGCQKCWLQMELHQTKNGCSAVCL